jgi:hypothetical protein
MIGQLAIAIFGLAALCMALGQHPRRRLLAPFVGLLGQPFWFAATWSAGAYGMFLVTCGYTAVYLWHARQNWRALLSRS